ncbi:amino acid ABC transporter substrate-binding protein [Eubacterium sp. F2]|uniref:amino acid ABC transporter substrate-binding protein n=1 Tax=Eubacterium sp. F2 TaxID=3381348 RepID=UPI003907EFF6
MKKSRKILAVLLTVVLGATMALATGCGSSSGSKDNSWNYIKKRGKLIIGLDDTFAPMGFRDKNNKIVGFDIDLAKQVGKELGIKVEFKPIDWDAKEAELKSKKIDCIWNGLSATPGRQKSMSLSHKYMKNRILIMSSDKSLKIKNASQLKKIKLGTQAGSSALEAIQKDKHYDEFKDNVKTYDDYNAALLDMKAGRIDAVAIDEVYAIYNNKSKTKLYESPYNFGADYYAVGFRKGDKALTKKVNTAIGKAVKNGSAAKISKKWFGKNMTIDEGYSK